MERFRNQYYNQLGLQAKNISSGLDSLLRSDTIELDKVRKLCERQELPLQYRPRVWSVLLGVLPPFPESWEFVSEQHKQQYDDTKRAALLLSTCSGAGASRLASHSVSDEAADLADDAHHQRDDEQEQIDLVSDASHSDGDSVVLSDGASSSIGRFDEDILPTTPPHSGSDKQHHAKPSRPTHHHHHHHHHHHQQQQQQQDTTQALAAHPLAPQQQQQQQLSTLLQLSESISSSSSGSSASSASSSASLTSCTTLVPSIVLSQVTKRNRLLALIYNASKLLDTRHKRNEEYSQRDLVAIATVFCEVYATEFEAYWSYCHFLRLRRPSHEAECNRGVDFEVAVLTKELANRRPALYEHLTLLDPQLVYRFSFRWFGSYFASCMPPAVLRRVWDQVIVLHPKPFLPFLATAVLIQLQSKLLQMNTADQVAEFLLEPSIPDVGAACDEAVLWCSDGQR